MKYEYDVRAMGTVEAHDRSRKDIVRLTFWGHRSTVGDAKLITIEEARELHRWLDHTIARAAVPA